MWDIPIVGFQGTDHGWRVRGGTSKLDKSPDVESGSESDNDDLPEVVSSKIAPEEVNRSIISKKAKLDVKQLRKKPREPKIPGHNLFASGPSLLRNVSF